MTPELKKRLQEQIDTSLAAYPAASGSGSCVHGYNILRWFLSGYIIHPDPSTQNDLMMFKYARDFEGNHIQKNSWKGYEILRSAKRKELQRTL